VHLAAPASGGPMPPAHRQPVSAGEQAADDGAEHSTETDRRARQEAARADHRARREAAEAAAARNA
jgi:hypothetical protein